MLTIDGSQGEGGGQIVRTAIGLAMFTRRPFRIEKVRAGREKPGLRRQHLTAVNAAARICSAEVEGAEVGSRQLTFRPGEVKPGEYHFAVGTAGSTTLVLQAVLPALLTAAGPSRLVLEGGTHNIWAPPFDFLAKAFLPLVSRMGPRVQATLLRHGFAPAGGGRMEVVIQPAERLSRLDLTERGRILSQQATALLARLPRHIAERELNVVVSRLKWKADSLAIVEIADSAGPGNAVMIEIQSEHVTEVFTGFGQRGVKAERVARGVVDEVQEYLESGVPVGRHLADQLLVPMALASEGSFVTLPLSQHAETNIEVIRKFLPVTVQPTPQQGRAVHVAIQS